jgi:Leucine-rich repeat (LRR) protein
MNGLTTHQLFGLIDYSHHAQDLSLNELSLKNLQDVEIDDPIKKITFIERTTYFLNNPDESILDFSDLLLNKLPDIFMHQSFKEKLLNLNLAGNELISVPESIGELNALKILNLSYNKILIALPESIAGLTQLEILNLSDNQLTALPQAIDRLTQLKNLNLAGNELISLPESIGELTALKILNLSYNKTLNALPESIGRLTQLEILNLSDNELTTLPESIGGLTALKELNLFRNNQLIDLPHTITNLNEDCQVNLAECYVLSEGVINRLNMGIGPSFLLADDDLTDDDFEEDQDEQKQPIEVLQNFCAELGKAPPPLDNVFNENNKDEFASLISWMNRLSYTKDSMSSPKNREWFFGCILEYLNLAEIDVDFLATFFAIIKDAGETCGDRVALSIIQLGIAQDLLKKNEIKDIYEFMKSCIFPMRILEECAINKITLSPDRDHLDQVEVYLGYPLKLKEELNIPINIKDMLYFQCSALTEEDLSEARNAVLQRVNTPATFLSFLIREPKWTEALKKNYNKEYNDLENTRESAGLADDADFMKIQEAFTQGLMKLTKDVLEKNDTLESESRHNRKRKRSQST